MCPVCKFSSRLINGFLVYIFNILLWLDEGINVWVFPILRMFRLIPKDGATGAAHYTVSQATAYAAKDGSRLAVWFCGLLTKVWSLWIKKRPYSHCYDAIHYADGTEIPQTEDEG